MLNKIEGHLVSGYADGGDDPAKQLELVPGAVRDARAFLESKPETMEHFERVSALVDGFETSDGMELLSTVHWVIRHGGADTPEAVVRETHAWGEGKKRFSPRQIGIAADVLERRGWL